MERIGIFGGSFDPPHIGHIQSAQQAAKALDLDRLLMIPAAAPPHKSGCYVSAEHRLSMLRIACGDDPVLQPSDMELRRSGPSYTYETVEAVRQAYPDAEIFLLMGSDMFLSFLSWKNPERILAQATLAVFCRGDKGEKEKIAQQKALLEQQGHQVCVVENHVVQISSTQMRRLLAFHCADEFFACRSRGLHPGTWPLQCECRLEEPPHGAIGRGGHPPAESQPGKPCPWLPGYGGKTGEDLGRR
jgi:nicotinate-nucleotide adenylyltransferase